MLIAVEGCIAAGKTTVATGLAAFRGNPPLIEDFEMNPFLRDFYEDPDANATETEFAFLLVHYHQLRKWAAQLATGEVISDFHLGKDLIFAEMNMSDPEELRLFRELNSLCAKRTARPDVLVFLSAPTSLICDRIIARGRDFEQTIQKSYYDQLNCRYEDFYETYQGEKIRLNMIEWDFVQQPDLFARLSLLIDEVSKTHKVENGGA